MMPVSDRSRYITGVYKIKNTVNGKVYIGSASQKGGIPRRLISHRSSLKNGKHLNKHLQGAWNKYGSTAFEFSTVVNCKADECLIYEQIFINQFKATDPKFGYNMCPVAGSALGVRRSDEFKENLSRHNKGKTLSAEHRAKISASHKGKKQAPMSVEGRANLSAALSGRKLSKEHKDKISETKRRKKIGNAEEC